MVKEILPNLVSPLMVETGLRLTYSIVIMAGLAFLGFGQQPPAANWGTMINENRIGLPLNPWAVIVPAAADRAADDRDEHVHRRGRAGRDRRRPPARGGRAARRPRPGGEPSRGQRSRGRQWPARAPRLADGRSGSRCKDLEVRLGPSGPDVVGEVSFAVRAGEVLGLVGESGSGKTTVALALLGHARRGLRIASGQVLLDGVDLLALSPAALRAARGAKVSLRAPGPVVRAQPHAPGGQQLREALRVHAGAVATPRRAWPRSCGRRGSTPRRR